MIEALLEGLGLIAQWHVLAYFVLGCVIGILMGAVPGMGGAIGLVLLLPFTFSMEPVAAFALLLSSWASTSTSGAITSVLLGVPSTAASQATVLDGYPMAKRGEAARALGASFTSSAIGGVCGAAALGISLPLILPVILAFESPEQFMLGMLGLAMVGSLSGQSIVKGVAAAMFGLLLATIGLPESQAIPRYTFGTLYLLDKLPLIPVLLGLFAIPEIMELAIKDVSIARTGQASDTRKGLLDGVRDAFRNWWLVVRCSVIGAYIGMLPGLGASIVGWATYAHAKQSVKDNSQFGQGDVRGLLAPEAANNALRGGALIPTLTLGIPGSVGTAILMGALIMHGLRPGPSMLSSELPMTFSFVWMIAIASVVATLVLLKTVGQVAKVALLPGHLVVPGVLLFVFMGAWLGGASIGAWYSCAVFGVIGFLMKRGGWPRPPVILALVLGEILERSFQISTRIHEGFVWLERPIVIVLLLIITLTIFLAARGIAREKLAGKAPAGEASEKNPAISLPFSLILCVTFAWAGYAALAWPLPVRQFPLLIAVPGLLLSLVVVIRDLLHLLETKKADRSWKVTLQQASKDAWLAEALPFFAYVCGMIGLTLLIGQKIAMPLFIGVYLVRWGNYRKRIAVTYALGAWAILVFFYDQVMSLLFHPSYLALWLQPFLPSGVPDWLFL
ncbi:MAG: tripartite tricarboxylate transporter permease [Woeseiaceae bacterium]|nr:tripartite tricarboxylate transporter permease [Woeseiaceae bacterium]